MPLPPEQPPSPRYTFVVRRPTPGRLVLEIVAPPAILLALADGAVLTARLEPQLERIVPLLVGVPAPPANRDA